MRLSGRQIDHSNGFGVRHNQLFTLLEVHPQIFRRRGRDGFLLVWLVDVESGYEMNTGQHWLGSLRIYLGLTTGLHLIWEVVQLPLYTIWNTAPPREIAFALFHCTVGDMMIATLSLVLSLVCFGSSTWPRERFFPVMLATLVIGVAYTVYSEWLNTVVRKAWAYSDLMPTLPLLGTGLSPLLQWIVVPMVGFALMRYRVRQPQP